MRSREISELLIWGLFIATDIFVFFAINEFYYFILFQIIFLPIVLLTNNFLKENYINVKDFNYITKKNHKLNFDLIIKKEELEAIKAKDILTGFISRETFKKKTQEEEKDRKGDFIIKIDISRFKFINDQFGQSIGDQVLHKVATIIKEIYQLEEKDIAARTNGDEFTILLNEKNKEIVEEKTKKFVERIEHSTFFIENKEIPVSCRIGVSRIENSITEGIKNANIALINAKKSHIATYKIITQSHQNTSSYIDDISLENELKNALDKGELYLNFQPKINLRTGEVYGAEALIRWESSKYQRKIRPDIFIAIAEKSSLIKKINNFIFEEAFKAAKRILKTHENFILSINVSPGQLMEEDYIVGLVENLSLVYGVNPSCIEIEVTETMKIENMEIASNELNKIKDLGIKISMDDFGTGQSSLDYLTSLPFDILKVDKSFVDDVPSNNKKSIILNNIYGLCDNLSLGIIFEGVESEEQIKFLEKLGDKVKIQGFFYSEPLHEAELISFIKEVNQLG